MRVATALISILILSGCQSFSAQDLSVPESEASAVRLLVEHTSISLGLAPCNQLQVKVEGADLCFGGAIGETSITVAGYRASPQYTVKVALYAVGRPDQDWNALVDKYKAAIASGLPGIQLVVRQRAELPRFVIPPRYEGAASAL